MGKTNPITGPMMDELQQQRRSGTPPPRPTINCPTCGRYIDAAGNGHAPACENGSFAGGGHIDLTDDLAGKDEGTDNTTP